MCVLTITPPLQKNGRFDLLTSPGKWRMCLKLFVLCQNGNCSVIEHFLWRVYVCGMFYYDFRVWRCLSYYWIGSYPFPLLNMTRYWMVILQLQAACSDAKIANELCPMACGKCCEDVSKDCAILTDRLDVCNKNLDFSLRRCRKSCGLCNYSE